MSLRKVAERSVINSSRYVNTMRSFTCSSMCALPMKPGTVLKHFGIFKGQDPPTVKARDEYPAYVNELAKPLPSLAMLRRIPNEEAEEKEIMRYLKLTRRLKIKGRNDQGAV